MPQTMKHQSGLERLIVKRTWLQIRDGGHAVEQIGSGGAEDQLSQLNELEILDLALNSNVSLPFIARSTDRTTF